MIDSEHNGKRILYVDHLGLQHSGVVIGEDEDGRWLYVNSDRYRNRDGAHFKIRVEWIDLLTVKA